MDINVPEIIKSLRTIYIVHLILIPLILIFNFVLLSQIYWLKEILKNLYFITTLISIIYFIVPIISLVFIFLKKLRKSNFKLFKLLSLIFCVITIILGFFFAGILMINTIESPEFCKECPFNLPITEINNLIQSNDLNKKCKERRCVINSENYQILEKNENDYYEYICNYDPSSEFDEIKESNDAIENNNNNINNNNATNKNLDTIKCNKIEKNNLIYSELENNFVFNFYDKCNNYADFYVCERTKTPNNFDLEEDFVCPKLNYMTKVIIFCMFNIILNLIIDFYPFKSEYNKYVIMTIPPRPNNPKTNSFSSTIHSSKLPKENFSKEENFEQKPTEILIICNNNKDNNNKINKINIENKENKLNKKEINNEENNDENNEENNDDNNDDNIFNLNINNETIIKKSNTKKLNINSIALIKKVKNNVEFKSSKNIPSIHSLKSMNKKEKEEKEDKKEKKSKFKEDENKVTLSYEDNTITTKRFILEGEQDSQM